MYNVCVCTDLFRSLSVDYSKRVEKGLYVCMYYIVHVSHARVGFYEVGQCSIGLLNLETTKHIYTKRGGSVCCICNHHHKCYLSSSE